MRKIEHSVASFLQKMARSKEFTLFGIVIVLITALLMGHQRMGGWTAFYTETLNDVTHLGGWSILVPFGLLSITSSVISMCSDRLAAALNNLGNWIGLVAVVLSGWVDFTLGNKAAILTYPVTFIIQGWAVKKWQNTTAYRAEKPLSGLKGRAVEALVVVASFIVSFGFNWIGFWEVNTMYCLVSIIFAFSLIANVFNAMKVKNQWTFWIIYNFVQTYKAIIQGNFANVGKYIYYILNSVCGIFNWIASRN